MICWGFKLAPKVQREYRLRNDHTGSALQAFLYRGEIIIFSLSRADSLERCQTSRLKAAAVLQGLPYRFREIIKKQKSHNKRQVRYKIKQKPKQGRKREDTTTTTKTYSQTKRAKNWSPETIKHKNRHSKEKHLQPLIILGNKMKPCYRYECYKKAELNTVLFPDMKCNPCTDVNATREPNWSSWYEIRWNPATNKNPTTKHNLTDSYDFRI